ncbi:MULTISPECIES: hypothetical protein [unclassified Modestobacter]|uniref:hypothetical protein n=1 Tax=unclassified Modestobacter TaxID=2643866 RepID=UPI0022AA2A93|nr:MULTISPECIES: hypothetical protein [unclassified Modestobacter]MCZ2825553.1 hypothetical protein [Modestobacter sp. VKM Ac-2981]MCZ2853382.1 hypothetical protein [Modestobacter sp. VKM Ac-2982]
MRFLASPPPAPVAVLRSVVRPARRRPSPVHLHHYRRAGDDPFSGASLYACRCGVVRPGM